jgi:hypothetical protein
VLRRPGHVERGEPHLVDVASALRPEEMLAG